jgi:hypothetical protein
MDWDTIGLEEIQHIVAEQLANATDEEKAFFARTAVPLSRWQLSPWGDQSGGFWVVAVSDDRVLWFNDIEDGFNVSRFTVSGRIPATEYWCNQDRLPMALRALARGPQGRFGPPRPL